MYKLTTRSKKAEKQFYAILNSREGIPAKMEKLKENPHKELDAHKLKGKLENKWSCSLGGDIRMVCEDKPRKASQNSLLLSAGL